MYTDDDIISAVRDGVLTEESASAFRDYMAAQRQTPIADEENFRLVTGFNDIFVVIACLLLLVSINWIGMSVANWFGIALHTVAAWGLAEYFTRVRRMALPSIVLLLSFVGGVLGTVYALLSNTDLGSDTVIALQTGIAAVGAWVHWVRFKVPITIAAGAGTIVACAIALLLIVMPDAIRWMSIIIFLSGLSVFSLAMRWDASDTGRLTRRSDVAFWLHLLAAPLLVHPIFSMLDVFEAQTGLLQASAVFILYAVIAIVSIAIDRRALMVSALIYVLYALSTLLNEFGMVSLGFATTAFLIGSGLLLLSAFWQNCRKAILPFYPVIIQGYLPPLR